MMHKGSCPEGNNESNDKLQGRKHEETVQQLRLKRMDAVLLVLLWTRDQRGAVGGVDTSSHVQILFQLADSTREENLARC